MGLSPFSNFRTEPPNPNPVRFRIEETYPKGDFVIAVVRYYGCTTYGGLKLLVYQGISESELRTQGSLDPHFGEVPGHVYPVARFEPTLRGLEMALTVVG